jgi:AcrR family transcriptional regulator
MGRAYQMTRRAEAMEDTRRRIVEAAVDLHGSLGPARTTISAIAARAGVERLTVYRHFPDEAQLFAACSQHWIVQNPPPDMAPWAAIENPDERLRRALADLYAYYRRTEGMLRNTLRDAPLVPALAGATAAWEDYLKAATDVLIHGRSARGRRRTLLLALIGHVLDFRVWNSLASRRVDDDIAVDLAAQLIAGSIAQSRSDGDRQ